MFGSIRSATLSVKQSVCNSLGLPFPDLLERRELDELVKGAKIKYYHRIYTPVVTLVAFMAQVLDRDGSCRQAVSRILSRLSLPSAGPPPSQHTAAYCKARSRLPLALLWTLIEWSTQRLDAQVGAGELWLGRHPVRVVAGSSCQPPDTEANRNAFGLPANVKPGCGFPVLPGVGVFSLATGLCQRLRFGKTGGHERHLFRQLINSVSPGEVVLGDRGFCSFADIYLLKQQLVECVFRIFKRKPDDQAGQRVGKYDHRVDWEKPKQCPAGMSPEEDACLPETRRVREVRRVVEQKGCRSKTLDLVTTLLDATF